MVNLWEWLMDGLIKFGGFQDMNYGITLVVSFQPLYFFLEVSRLC